MSIAHGTTSPDLVVVVSTANRPEILHRCIASATSGCSQAQAAHWIVLDDSASTTRGHNLEVLQTLRRAGLTLTYVDETVERELHDALSTPAQREAFAQLITKRAEYRIPGIRTLALLVGLTLEPRTLIFLDDDMVHHHGSRCFFHWAATHGAEGSFTAAARQRGIRDMDYTGRLAILLERDDWPRFMAPHALTGPAEAWYGPDNPLWNRTDDDVTRYPVPEQTWSLNTGVIALRNVDARWLPFPDSCNEDLMWSVLQSATCGTPMLKIRGIDVSHLPPAIGHRGAETVVSELFAQATFESLARLPTPVDALLREISRFQDQVVAELRLQAFRVLTVEARIRRAAATTRHESEREQLAAFEAEIRAQKRLLQGLDVPCRVLEWLQDFDRRCQMFSMLRESTAAQAQLREVILRARISAGPSSCQ